MDNSFGRALLAAFAPDLKVRFQPRATPLDIKLHVERIRLTELIRAAHATQMAGPLRGSAAQKSASISIEP